MFRNILPPLGNRPLKPSSKKISQREAARATRERLIRLITANQKVVDVGLLKEAALRPFGLQTVPKDLQNQKRRNRLLPLAFFLANMVDPFSTNPHMRSFARQWPALSLELRNSQTFSDAIVKLLFFDDPDGDRLTTLFEIIMQDDDLLAKWMRSLDAHVLARSQANQMEMDQVSQTGSGRVRKNVVLVGGGPNTSIVASVLGLFFRVTVITEQRGLGKPWRNTPIFMNSSSVIKDGEAMPLPLLGGTTTRVIGRQLPGNLDSNVLLGRDTLDVVCDDGTVVQYASGLRLGALVATNILFNADDFLVNQRVEISQFQHNPDGSLRLVLIDTEDGTKRELDADAVFLLTGPGKEHTKVEDARTQALYRESSEQLLKDIQRARVSIAPYREALRRLESELPTPAVLEERKLIRDRIAQASIKIPHVLSLFGIQALYDFWQDDLAADPALYPLNDLFTVGYSTAYGGNADTMRTLKELREKRGPKNAYPTGLIVKEGRSLIYNEGTSSPKEYDQANRRRYRGTFTKRTSAIPFKVSRYRLIRDRRNGQERVEVFHRDANGVTRRRVVDYFFDCTGLDRSWVEALLPTTLSLQNIRDQEGIVVARGNIDANLFVAGPATGFNAADFPAEIQTIIQVLGIPENTLALWVHGALTERVAWWFVATHLPISC